MANYLYNTADKFKHLLERFSEDNAKHYPDYYPQSSREAKKVVKAIERWQKIHLKEGKLYN